MTKPVVVFGGFVTEDLSSQYNTAAEAVADGYPVEDSGDDMFVIDAPDDVITCCYRYDSTKTGDERFYGVELAENECYTPYGIRNYTKELNEAASAVFSTLSIRLAEANAMIEIEDTSYDWESYKADLKTLLKEVLPYKTATVTEETNLNVIVPDYADYPCTDAD